MKIIDIFNKIANNKIDENPNKIKYEGQIWLKQASGDYIDSENISRYLFDDYMSFGFETLNDEIEIIEEDKKIEKLFNCCMETDNQEIQFCIQNINDVANKINELIDEVNKLKGDKNEK